MLWAPMETGAAACCTSAAVWLVRPDQAMTQLVGPAWQKEGLRQLTCSASAVPWNAVTNAVLPCLDDTGLRIKQICACGTSTTLACNAI